MGESSGAETPTAANESAADRSTILVLRDGGVLTGRVSPTENGYLIHRGGTEIQVPAAKVLIACRTLADGYEARRAEINAPSAEAHLTLATWCLSYGLKSQAARELADVRALDSSHPRLALLERRLAAISAQPPTGPLRKTPAASAPATVSECTPTPHDILPETVTGPVVERFTRKVQPILVNNCTTSGCHQRGGSQKFQLDRALLHGLANRRSTTHNLSATLRLIDRNQPQLSQLLVVPRQTHGGMNAPIFGPRHATVFSHLVEWVALVTRPEPSEPTPLPTQDTNAETALANNSEGMPILQNKTQADATTSIAKLTKGDVPLPEKPVVRYGVQLQPWRPKDDFDPEIFNRLPGAPMPVQAAESTGQTRSPTALR
jgi:hypothetical protein